MHVHILLYVYLAIDLQIMRLDSALCVFSD